VPTQFAFRTVALLAVFAFAAGCLAAVAGAQTAAPTPPQRTLVAVGSGTVSVTPNDKNSNASIVAAVKSAEGKALPAAYKDAQAQAAALAAAGGVTLGPVISLANSAAAGNAFFGIGVYGTTYGSFGRNTYCGNIRTRTSKVGKDGVRHYGPFRTRRVCRAPNVVQRTVQLTYALA
jgi:uncharacterized protein YggE